MSLDKCEEKCVADRKCKAIDFGKNGRANQCYMNFADNLTSYKVHSNFDAYTKSCESCIFKKLCTSCDYKGSEKKVGKMSLEDCKQSCIADEKCQAIDFGKGGRANEC